MPHRVPVDWVPHDPSEQGFFEFQPSRRGNRVEVHWKDYPDEDGFWYGAYDTSVSSARAHNAAKKIQRALRSWAKTKRNMREEAVRSLDAGFGPYNLPEQLKRSIVRDSRLSAAPVDRIGLAGMGLQRHARPRKRARGRKR